MKKIFKEIDKYLKNPENKFSIFLFHGVIKKNPYRIRNYDNKHIKISNFHKIIKYLSKNGNKISIDDIVYHLEKNKKFNKNCFLVSFDDGFENNCVNACPILDEYKIPTIFYFSTDFVENNSISWIDKLEYGLEKTKKKKIFIDQFNNSFEINTNYQKIKILNLIRHKIKSDLNVDLNIFTNNILNQLELNVPVTLNSEIDKKISWSQLKKMKSNDLFSFGGHSHNHHSLVYSEKRNKMEFEIKKSIKLFKEKAGLVLKHYSYPEGQEIDFNNNVIKVLKKNKIISCPTAIKGINKSNQNLFKMFRVQL